MAELAFYSVGDARYFPGVAALVNSLRLTGHRERIVILDCGLEPRQRERLVGEATLLPATGDLRPNFLKWEGPLAQPADVMAILDADVLAVRSLAPLAELAAPGRFVAFVDLNPDRYDDSWAGFLGVEDVPRRPYVNTGVVVLPRSGGLELLERLRSVQPKLPLDLVEEGGGRPFKHWEQDVFNPMLAATVPEDAVAVLERRLAPVQPFAGLRVANPATLECRYPDGEQPFVLHHLYSKPWRGSTPPSPYTRLLSRVLLADDVPIRLAPEELPLHLRPGLAAATLRAALGAGWLATRARFKLRLLLGR